MASLGNVVEFTTIHSDNIKDIFETLKEILHDINIVWEQDCLKIISVNRNKTICVYLKLTADEISKNGSYYCKTKRCTGIHVPTFYKLIKQISKNDTISITVNESEPNYLFIKLMNDKKDHHKELTYKLIEIGEEQIETLPDIEFGCETVMLSNDFSKYIKDLSVFSCEMEITATRDEITLVSDGDFGKGKIIIPDDTGDTIIFSETEENEVIQSKFALKFLQMFTKATNLNQNLKLYICNYPEPLMIEYTIPNMGVLRFLLLPLSDP